MEPFPRFNVEKELILCKTISSMVGTFYGWSDNICEFGELVHFS